MAQVVEEVPVRRPSPKQSHLVMRRTAESTSEAKKNLEQGALGLKAGTLYYFA
ncbi:hypothetical protein COLO4_24031 [Corchorus olitorius]|uniref:Uncharacterized protein n=1 Tax=Corchorus olitorius TaxID=93759 RepID=A0A1R3IDG0_9ROSI|nr:hypothetical protein COLO4_24031 [Corchorus olitorius]